MGQAGTRHAAFLGDADADRLWDVLGDWGLMHFSLAAGCCPSCLFALLVPFLTVLGC